MDASSPMTPTHRHEPFVQQSAVPPRGPLAARPMRALGWEPLPSYLRDSAGRGSEDLERTRAR